MPEDIIVDFKVDYSELDAALATLEKTGAIDTKIAGAFKNTTTAIKGTSTETKELVQTFKNVSGAATIMGKGVKDAFDKGVTDALDQAGVSVEQFASALKKSAAAPLTLKQELKQLTAAIAEAKVNGTDLGQEFDAMRKRAGSLKDAIADANAEIKNAGSDTRGIDNVIGSVSAVAGGFAAAQGAAALFGGESEDLQKALLKVNAAMALSQGLQQISNALQKEGSLVKLADATATGFQTVAQQLYTAVTGRATAATLAFKVALASTGILAIVGVLYAAGSAMGFFDDAVDKTTDSFEELNKAIERNIALSDKMVENNDFNTKLLINDLKIRGASEEEINKATVNSLRTNQDIKLKLYHDGLDKLRDITKKKNDEIATINKDFGSLGKYVVKKAIEGVNAKYDAEITKSTATNAQLLTDANKTGQSITLFKSDALVKQSDDQRAADKKAAADRKAANEKAAQEAKAARARQLQDELAAIQLRLLAVKEGTQAEVDIQKEVIAKKADIELNAEKLGASQIALIKAQALKDQLQLQRDFNTKLTTEQLQGQIDANRAALADINITNEEKLRLTIENIEAQARIEVLAAKGNADAIAAISAKSLQDINAAKKASLDEALEYEISVNNTRTAEGRRALERLLADEKTGIEQRIAIIKTLLDADTKVIDKRIANLEDEHAQGLISERDYIKQLAELQDQRAVAVENANAKIKDSTEKADKVREESRRKQAEDAIAIASQVADLFANLNALATEQERQRIEGQKSQLQELIDAGAITKKQADIRRKEIETEEKKARQQAAQRDKQAAVFKALLAIPSAFLEGLVRGGPILGAIYAAIAAANAAIVIARPIPKFAKGKKGNYEGPGVVGDAGAELVERNGRMYLTTQPTVMYLGAKDKVFTHAETKVMLHDSSIPRSPVSQATKIDYDRLAKLMGNKGGPTINIDRDFISESVANGLQKNNYFNQRYRF